MTEVAAVELPAPAPSAALEHCPNCNALMHGPFCYACGQSKKGLIRHFSSIIGDFFDSVLSIDSRTLRTLGPLYFRPGFLSTEYFAGRRVRYVTPLRLYFFLSVVAFLLISLVTPPLKPEVHMRDGAASGTITPEERDRELAELDSSLVLLPDAERARVRGGAEVGSDLAKADRTAAAVAEAQRGDDDMDLHIGGKRWDPKANPLRLAWLTDGMNAALNTEIGELLAKARSITRDPGPFVKQVYATAPQALFVILPLFALLLKIFYVFKRRLYMEHLIVALHSHSFICLSLLFAIASAKAQEWTATVPVLPKFFGLLFVLCWIWVPAYLLLMQKRVYRQGWIMTTLKFAAIGFCYVFLLLFGTLATMLVSLVLL